MMRRTFILFAGVVIGCAVIFQSSTPALAAVSGWQAGNIMSDSVMSSYKSMSPAQIQSFLNSKVTSCDTNGQQLSEYGGPDLNNDGRVQRWEWGKSKYNQSKFVCLKDYKISDGRTASRVIYDVAQKYQINPRVLIVLLQKEQSLVTDSWPLNIQYRTATGYGCPDTAPCDSQYYGLLNQLDWAAKMFRSILNNSPNWYTPYVLGNNYIQYNPSASCGGSTVKIVNRATQALYNYTPYQPNSAALKAGWGTASCGAYGNRNFYLYFTNWFGTTRGLKYVSMDTKRWMQLERDTQKRDTNTLNPVDGVLAAGTHIYFPHKIYLNGEWYLRTQTDTDRSNDKVIPLSDVTDIRPSTIANPRYMELNTDSYKINPLTGYTNTFRKYAAGTTAKFMDQITINGKSYYRTETSSLQSDPAYFKSNSVSELVYEPFSDPRFMNITANTNKVNPATGEVGSALSAGTTLRFTEKVDVLGKWYYQADTDSTASNDFFVPASDISNITFTPLDTEAAWMNVTNDTQKVDPLTGAPSSTIVKSTFPQVRIADKIVANGVTYFRTTYDAAHGKRVAIPASSLESIVFVPLDTPRQLSLHRSAYKIAPVTGKRASSVYGKGLTTRYDTKAFVNGEWYLRTNYDTVNGFDRAFPYSVLN